MKEFWNKIYSEKEYAYGMQPNSFFKNQITKLIPGSILLPAEGEGRNAVYAAKLGWKVTAFDISDEARKKAMLLATSQNTSIEYIVSSVMDFYTSQQFDAIGLIYNHFPAEIRKSVFEKMLSFVKPGGKIIFEAFSKEQISFKSGGPKDESMLFSLEEIKQEFENVSFNYLRKENIVLNEGNFHKGMASVIRMVGTKKGFDALNRS